KGKLVVVIETASAGAIGSTLNQIALLPDVFSAALEFHAIDAAASGRTSLPQSPTAVRCSSWKPPPWQRWPAEWRRLLLLPTSSPSAPPANSNGTRPPAASAAPAAA